MDPGKRFDGPPDQPDFTPPGRLPGQNTGNGNSLRWFVALLVVVLLLGLLVVFVLPDIVERQGATPAPALATDVPPASPAVDTSADARAEAEQALQSYLELRARLELDNVSAWGEPEWGRSAAHADDGDRQFSQRRFRPAADAYTAALALLQGLADGREPRFTAAMEEGDQALAVNDSDTATGRYTLALAIHPENAEAVRGLERARLRPDVLAFMKQGEQAEGPGDLAPARSAYAQAVEMDAEFQPAVAALERVSTRLAGLAYQEAMTRTLAALDSGRLGEADRALREAAAIRPDDTAVRDAGRRLAAARLGARLASLRRRAEERVQAEDWQDAAALYRQALKMDPNAGFGREGLTRAEARARLHEQIDHYLDRPSRLYSDEPLANAGQLLETAAAAPDNEPVLAGKVLRLRQLVDEAATPLSVSLRSDGRTEIVIYHVGRLGRFNTHSLRLRPGDYTVVGSRDGYRDVRKTLSVRPGKAVPVMTVQCEEPV